jgi:hypothetical protein
MNLDAPTIVVPLTSLLMVHLLLHDHAWWLSRFFPDPSSNHELERPNSAVSLTSLVLHPVEASALTQ